VIRAIRAAQTFPFYGRFAHLYEESGYPVAVAVRKHLCKYCALVSSPKIVVIDADAANAGSTHATTCGASCDVQDGIAHKMPASYCAPPWVHNNSVSCRLDCAGWWTRRISSVFQSSKLPVSASLNGCKFCNRRRRCGTADGDGTRSRCRMSDERNHHAQHHDDHPGGHGDRIGPKPRPRT
jgi:hypothetical protein